MPGPSDAAFCAATASATRAGGAKIAAIAPSPGSAPIRLPARRGEAQALLQAEDAGGVRGRDFAQAVPEHHV